MAQYILALDQGTTSSRAILFDREQNILAIRQHELTQHYPHEGWVEQDPMDIWSTQYAAMLEVLAASGVSPREIAGIGITNQRETTILWERETGRPIYNAIVWQCRRTADIVDGLVAQGLSDHIRQTTGLIPDAYFSGTKIKWILDHVEGAREKAARGDILFGTVDSWLVWKLTGGKVHITDATNAARTMIFNIHTLDWDDTLLEALDIPRAMLPRVCSSSEVYGTVAIPGGDIPIAGIAGDQQAALFGQTCFSPGDAKNTYGTGCFLLMNAGSKCPEGEGLITTLCASADGAPAYALEGSVFIGGAAVQWLRDGLGIISSASETEELAERVKDSAGLYFVPSFNGLGAPYWDGGACGILSGITRGARKEHVVRAVLEGIAYRVNDVLRAMEAASGTRLTRLAVDGGASANNFLMGFQADISDCTVVRPAVTEVTSLGAAYIAGLASGFWSGVDELKKLSEAERTFSPAMDEERRSALLGGWKSAVARARSK